MAGVFAARPGAWGSRRPRGRHRTLRCLRQFEHRRLLLVQGRKHLIDRGGRSRNTPVKGSLSSRIRKTALPTAKAPKPRTTRVVQLTRDSTP